MDQSLRHKVFESSACLSKQQLISYNSAVLSPADNHVVETHLLTCELCTDAMEGVAMVALPEQQIMQLNERAKALTSPANGFSWRTSLAIAATITGVLVGVYWLLNSTSPNENSLAENKPNIEKLTEETIDEAGETEEMAPIISTDSVEEKLEIQPKLVEHAEEIYIVEVSETGMVGSKLNHCGGIPPPQDIDHEPLTDNSEDFSSMDVNNEIVASNSAISVNQDVTINGNSAAVASTMPTAKEEQKSSETELPTAYLSDLKVVDYEGVYRETDPYPAKTKAAEQKKDENLAFAGGVSPQYANDESETMNEQAELEINTVELRYEAVLQKGLNYFDKGRYMEALVQFNYILEKYPQDQNGRFYSGMSNYHLKKYAEAITWLNAVMQESKSPFFPEAEWYKAMALSKNGQTAEAKTLLHKIANEGGYYSEMAKKELGD